MSSGILWSVGTGFFVLALLLWLISAMLPEWRFKTIALLRTIGVVLGVLTAGTWAGALVMAFVAYFKRAP
jgi:hypothetical protein